MGDVFNMSPHSCFNTELTRPKSPPLQAAGVKGRLSSMDSTMHSVEVESPLNEVSFVAKGGDAFWKRLSF